MKLVKKELWNAHCNSTLKEKQKKKKKEKKNLLTGTCIVAGADGCRSSRSTG